MKKNIRAGTIEGKGKRSKAKHSHINKQQKEYMDSVKAGTLYETGMAVKIAKRNLPTTKDRNPEGTPSHLLRCIYYHETDPLACNVLGHLDFRNANCQMKPKSKSERKEVIDALEKYAISVEMNRIMIEDEFSFLRCEEFNSIVSVKQFRIFVTQRSIFVLCHSVSKIQ